MNDTYDCFLVRNTYLISRILIFVKDHECFSDLITRTKYVSTIWMPRLLVKMNFWRCDQRRGRGREFERTFLVFCQNVILPKSYIFLFQKFFFIKKIVLLTDFWSCLNRKLLFSLRSDHALHGRPILIKYQQPQ